MKEIEAEFQAAFEHAIRKMGLVEFKRISIFGSNDAKRELKQAA